MKKIFVFFCLLFVSFSYPQNHRYAWLTDMHVGATGADEDLTACVNSINALGDIGYVIVTGDISEKGRDQELISAKNILDKLTVPYFIIPGNHDTKWSENGNTLFRELWKDDKFVFDKNNIRHIGLNTGIYWRGGGGHVAPQDLAWFDSVINATPRSKEVFVYVHHVPDGDIDNWYKLYNIAIRKNTKAFFWGHGHNNKLQMINEIPGVMSRSTLRRGKGWGYTVVEDTRDSIAFYENLKDSLLLYWGSIRKDIRPLGLQIDSTDFEDYSGSVKWKKDLSFTQSASLLVYNSRIYSVTYNGKLRCFDLRGNLVWQYDLGSCVASRPVAQDNILAVATLIGDVFTFNADDGRMIQSLGTNEKITSQLQVCKTRYQGEETWGLIFGTSTGKMYCYDLYLLNPVWENDFAKGMIETRPLVIDNRIIYGSWDSFLYCIDAVSGTLNWRHTENRNFYYSPAACVPVTDGSRIYIARPDKFVTAIDILLGKTLWNKNNFNAWESIGLSSDKSRVLIKSVENNFFIAAARDGKLIKKIDMKYGLDTMPVELFESGGNIIFGGKNGFVYHIDNKNNFRKLFYMGQARIHSIYAVTDNVFAASNMDGRIVLFSI
ncbi:MAG: PQQ-binding-like beta-propeller repeat protein [Ignavibacteriaceae bacterium]|nr:PQQ-binding-like beta-propeller repeat protein [Ignavibacteriaceae bacterium]